MDVTAFSNVMLDLNLPLLNEISHELLSEVIMSGTWFSTMIARSCNFSLHGNPF